MTERHYFLIPPQESRPDTVTLGGDEFRHCVRVCRVGVGETVTLLDGRGGLFDARIERIGEREALLSVLGAVRALPQPPLDMAIGMLKAPRLDFALEKCTEIGCRTLILFGSTASIARADRGGAARLDRMRRKLAAACKQSGQPYLPDIALLPRFEELLEHLSGYGRIVLADAGSDGRGLEMEVGSGAVLGVVGPEGGLTAEERGALLRRGALPFSLGAARLRSETAAVCLLYRLSSDMLEACGRG